MSTPQNSICKQKKEEKQVRKKMELPNTNTKFFTRSISNKESPSFSDLPCLPPRLSTNTTSFPLSPPPNLFSITPTKPNQTPNTTTTHYCVSSILKKDGQILSIASSNGLVYTGSNSNVIRVWKLPQYIECGQLKTKASMVVALEVSNDRVYAAYADGKIRVWRRTWEGALKHVRLAKIPSTRSYLRSYISAKDKMIMKHIGLVTSLAMNVGDDILYSASLDKTVKVWRVSDFKCIETIQAHSEPINAVIASDDGVLYTASDDATVRVWRRNFCSTDSAHSLTVTLPAKYSPVKTLTLTSDGTVLYGGCSDGYVHYWLKGWFSGQLQYGGALQGHTHAVMCLANVGNYLISGSADSTGRVWVRDQEGLHLCVAVLQGHRGPIRCVAGFGLAANARGDKESDEGCTICTGGLDGVIKIWRVMSAGSVARSSLRTNGEYFEL